MAVDTVSRIKCEVASHMERDRKLVDQVATYLASQNNDDVVPFYTRQADEILAMVREGDQASLSTQEQVA